MCLCTRTRANWGGIRPPPPMHFSIDKFNVYPILFEHNHTMSACREFYWGVLVKSLWKLSECSCQRLQKLPIIIIQEKRLVKVSCASLLCSSSWWKTEWTCRCRRPLTMYYFVTRVTFIGQIFWKGHWRGEDGKCYPLVLSYPSGRLVCIFVIGCWSDLTVPRIIDTIER